MNYIRKILPVNIYDIDQIETYLRDMASKGLFIKKIGFFTYFEKGEPKKTEYRLEPLMKKESIPDNDIIEIYKKSGWEYVCTLSNSFHIYKTNLENPIEIHTDPIAQSYTFEYLNEKLRNSYLISIIFLPISIFMILYSLSFNGHPVVFAVKYGLSSMFYMTVILSIFTFYNVIINRIKIKKLTSQLRLGFSMSHKKKYNINYLSHIFNIIIIAISLSTVYISLRHISSDWDKNLYEYNGKLPSITLAQIENSANFEIEISKSKDKDYNNHISYSWTDLAPRIYQVRERGIIKGKLWDDMSGEYSPSLKTEFYDLRFKFLAKPLIRDIISDELEFFRYEPVNFHEFLETNFDYAAIIQVDETQMFFGILNKEVIYVRYHGYSNLSNFIGEIYDSVSEF